MIFSNIFKRQKRKDEPQEFHYYHGIIVTSSPLEVNSSHIISLFSIKDKIYANMNYIFFDIDNVRAFIRSRLLHVGGYGPLYIYYISVHPLCVEDDNSLTQSCDENRHVFDISNVSDLDIRVLEDCTNDEYISGICPGIETVDELKKCLSIGYEKMLNTDIRKKYMNRFHDADVKNKDIFMKTISTALYHFSLDIVIDIFDRYYMRYDGWENEFNDSIQELLFRTIKK